MTEARAWQILCSLARRGNVSLLFPLKHEILGFTNTRVALCFCDVAVNGIVLIQSGIMISAKYNQRTSVCVRYEKKLESYSFHEGFSEGSKHETMIPCIRSKTDPIKDPSGAKTTKPLSHLYAVNLSAVCRGQN